MLSRLSRHYFCSISPQPWLFVGLGNPGDKFKGTQHNVGFEMIDAFAEAVGIPMDTVHCKAVFGKGFVNGVPVFLAKPQTYINLSGESTLVEVHTTGNLKFSCLRKYGSLHFPSGRMAKHQSDRIKTFLEELNDFPKLLCSKPIQLTDKVTEQYLEEYGIVDAASFLLERVGDVGSALMLILSGLNEKFIVLEASIGPSDSRPKHFNSILKEEEWTMPTEQSAFGSS